MFSDAHLGSRESSWMWVVPPSSPVHFWAFLSCLYPDLVPEPASKVEETWKIWQLWWPSASDRSWLHSCSQVRYHSEYQKLHIKPLRERALSCIRSPLHMGLCQRRRTGKREKWQYDEDKSQKMQSNNTLLGISVSREMKPVLRIWHEVSIAHDPSPFYHESHFGSKSLPPEISWMGKNITFATIKPCFFIDSQYFFTMSSLARLTSAFCPWSMSLLSLGQLMLSGTQTLPCQEFFHG